MTRHLNIEASRRLNVRATVVTAILAMGFARTASAQETRHQLWPELDAYVRLSPAARLFFLFAPVAEDNEFEESQVGAHLDVGVAPIRHRAEKSRLDQDRLRYLRFRVGIRQTFSFTGDERARSETRVIAEVTPRCFLPWEILVAVRNRFDFRWIEGDYSWHYLHQIDTQPLRSYLNAVGLVAAFYF